MWQEHPKPFRKVFFDPWFLGVLAFLLLFTDWLGHRWIFERATLQGSDVIESVLPLKQASICSLVTIDENDYAQYLGECLSPAKLEDVIKEIIKYGPKVIAVDVDTSASRFKNLHVQATGTKLVWARLAAPVPATGRNLRQRSYNWELRGVLGGQIPPPDYAGVSLFPQDPDWTVRGFEHQIPFESQHATAPSFHSTIVRAYCDCKPTPLPCSVLKGAEEREISSNWDFQTVSLGDLMRSGRSIAPSALTDIVILGASTEDVHETQFGAKLGAELVAAAVETELTEPLGPPNLSHSRIFKWAIKFFLAVAIGWMNSQWRPLWATSGMLVLLVLVFLASFFGVYYHFFKLDFFPFMVGMWIEQLIDSSTHAHRHQPG